MLLSSIPTSIAQVGFGAPATPPPPLSHATLLMCEGLPCIDAQIGRKQLIFSTSVEKLGLATKAQSKTSQYFAFTDGGVDMFQSEASQIAFGSKTVAAPAPLYFAGTKVHLPDGLFDGTIGADLLASQKVTLNFHDNKFWLD